MSLIPTLAVADTLTVPGDYPTIQNAIDAAVTGDEIVIADGLYIESLSVINKGITLRSASGDPTTCTVAAGAGLNALYINTTGNLVTRAEGLSFTESQYGIVVTQSGFQDPSVLITNCRMVTNEQGAHFSFTDVVVDNCVIAENAPITLAGGGVEIISNRVTFDRCTFLENAAVAAPADSGGGGAIRISNGVVDLRRSTLQGNTSDLDGGAIYTGDAVTLTISACTLEANHAERHGGGLLAAGAVVMVRNSTVRANSARAGGALVADDQTNLSIVNSVLALNEATEGVSGAVATFDGSTANLTATTIVGNSALSSGSGLYSDLDCAMNATSLIVVGDTGKNLIAGDGETSITFSLVQGGYAGAGNIAGAPGFVDVVAGNYRLGPGSPCIDAGDSFSYSGPAVDRDGAQRMANVPAVPDTGVVFIGAAIDMGAYEFQPDPDACPGDVDGDGVVSVADILIILGGWGTCPP